ncbi:hypothetical protein [Rhodopirellula baltica]|uniref:Uncharacterized protein n=1 Tax=Rhodopirellula baltica SWK14 TaxID=993516 RepID=L7CQH1_RHOBT|nr:hypothetical protein [Rhodopirellula baltica]ELP36065.1 hypothetical protein RBSWK_00129 [Rhodopirellula baltica SWK14]
MQLPAAWQGVYSYDSMPEQLGLSETAFDLIIRPRRLGRFDGGDSRIRTRYSRVCHCSRLGDIETHSLYKKISIILDL